VDAYRDTWKAARFATPKTVILSLMKDTARMVKPPEKVIKHASAKKSASKKSSKKTAAKRSAAKKSAAKK
jgi:hypothetical protein